MKYLLVQSGVAIDHMSTSIHLVVVELPLNPGLQEIVTSSWKAYFTLLLSILVTGWLKFNDV